MRILDDGTVIPSFLGTADRSYNTPGARLTLDDSSLRVGEVITSYPPDAQENVSHLEVEYIVMVNYRNSAGALTPTTYRCTLRDGFGSPGLHGDHYRHSLRQRTAQSNQDAVTDGAIVLVACINGDKSNAVIIDCLKHPQRTVTDPPSIAPGQPARFLDFEFNGVQVVIGDDGSLKLTVPGATTNDGSPDPARDPNNAGAFVQVAANGTITVTDASTQTVTISPVDQRITVQGTNVKVVASDTQVAASDQDPTIHVTAQGIELGATVAAPPVAPVSLAPAANARFQAIEAKLNELATIINSLVLPVSGSSAGPPAAPLATPISPGPDTSATKVKAI